MFEHARLRYQAARYFGVPPIRAFLSAIWYEITEPLNLYIAALAGMCILIWTAP